MNFGWLWRVSVNTPIVTNAPLWWGIYRMGETMHVWEQEVYGHSVPFSQFCCKPKPIFEKNKVFKYKKEKPS